MMWDDIQSFFNFINENSEYVVLRNWDNLPTTLLNGEDLDILVADKESFLHLVNPVPKYKNKYRSNYYINIGGFNIRIDIRSINDGYYPNIWCRLFLEERFYNTDINLYVLNDSDYLSALLYHSIIQKPYISDKYNEMIRLLSNQELAEYKDFVIHLKKLLYKSNCKVTMPQDFGVYVNEQNIKIHSIPSAITNSDKLFRLFNKLSFKITK